MADTPSHLMPPELNIDIAERDDGWLATVTVREGASSTTHAVTISREVLDRLAPGSGVADLVRASFEFLLDQEAKESILREFDIEVIERYFPDYRIAMMRRLEWNHRGT